MHTNKKYYGYYEPIIIGSHNPRPDELEKELQSILPSIVTHFLSIFKEYNLGETPESLVTELLKVRVRFSPEIKESKYTKNNSIELIQTKINEAMNNNPIGPEREILNLIAQNLGWMKDAGSDPRDIEGTIDSIKRQARALNFVPEWLKEIINMLEVSYKRTLGEYYRKQNYIVLYPRAIRSNDMNKYYQVYAHEIFHALHFYFIKKKHPRFSCRKSYDPIIEGLASFFEYLYVRESLHRDEYAEHLMNSWKTNPEVWPYSYARNFFTDRPHLYLYSLIFLNSVDKMRDTVATIKQINESNKLLRSKP